MFYGVNFLVINNVLQNLHLPLIITPKVMFPKTHLLANVSEAHACSRRSNRRAVTFISK